jgi:dolichyl-phosphate beta-glucosyltransferase
LVLPAFNERPRLTAALPGFLDTLRKHGSTFEVLVVDDGSTDGTGKGLHQMVERFSEITYLRLARNVGKGQALLHGVLKARGQFIITLDGDLPYTVENVVTVLNHLEQGADVVIGDRTLPESRLDVHPNILRQVSGRALSHLLAITLFRGYRFPDTQCGLKGYRRESAIDLFSHLTTFDFGCDIDLILQAVHHQLKIERVPVTLQANGQTQVHLLRDSFLILQTVWKLWRQPTHHHEPFDYTSYDGGYQQRALLSGNAMQRFWHQKKLELMDQLIQPTSTMTVYDVGCGSGNLVFHWAGHVQRIVGFDVAETVLNFCRQEQARRNLSNVSFAALEHGHLPAGNATADVVILTDVIEHLDHQQSDILLQEIVRTLKPGGRLLLTTPNVHSAWPGIEYLLDHFHKVPALAHEQHINMFTPQRLQSTLINAGFMNVRIGTAMHLSPFLALAFYRLAAWLFTREQRQQWPAGMLLFAVAQKPNV